MVDFDNEDDALLLVVSDNVRRRQLGPIALARIYDTLSRIQWAEGRQPGTDLRDEIAGRIGGKCGRTLDRYRRLLRLPRAILQAVESGQLAMSVGFRILRLPSNVQDEIAAEIDRGEEADQVVARHLRGHKAMMSISCGNSTAACSESYEPECGCSIGGWGTWSVLARLRRCDHHRRAWLQIPKTGDRGRKETKREVCSTTGPSSQAVRSNLRKRL